MAKSLKRSDWKLADPTISVQWRNTDRKVETAHFYHESNALAEARYQARTRGKHVWIRRAYTDITTSVSPTGEVVSR